MKTNSELQLDVQNAIKWEPLLNAAEIGVTVKDGVVTLTGTVDGYSKKLEAEGAAKRVTGVRAVAEEIKVKFHNSFAKKDDTEIATEVLKALSWNLEIPSKGIQVKVENGWVSISGEVPWNHQREAVSNAVRYLPGLVGLNNALTIKANMTDRIEKHDIEAALKRNWAIDRSDIEVTVLNHNVTLKGKAKSWYQKEEATRVAWNALGVWSVDNELVIDYN
jgi:osmotically-inducible protein OsmY